tara:strand:+ start:27 stop:434 length:408 start_codon:yes stop_codon:yes gene_type:complete
MGVPNTTTFTMDDVFDEVGYLDLVTCFSNSVDSYFNPSYKGSKDRLSNFRDYKVTVTLTSFSSSVGSSSQYTACQQPDNQTYYHDGSSSIPEVGDNVYSDSSGTTGVATNYYFNGLGTYEIHTGGTTVTSTDLCL